ncbi:hypothetical protein PQE66_gp015 [Bacillus phage PBC2]|uniref:DUF7222 domain-containing protein n=1 Tax=Bacillus phage PBC2 TaxID=1675029 RepID=A0A218KBR2_9CAUD|nr:hypothetical protein PQE66_gp015 [Bacillus phage PBC2]AKQ08330.1 hypothetical protein PBC2_015 [Bacillus phage PBC2]
MNTTKFELSNTKGSYYVSNLKNELYVYNNIDEPAFNILGYDEGVSVDFTKMTHEQIVQYIDENYSFELEHMEGKDIIQLLENLKTRSMSDMKKEIISDMLENEDREDIEQEMKDIANYGMESLGKLLYHNEVVRFWDKYYNEIKELAYYYKRMTGCCILSKIAEHERDIKADLSRFAYETTVKELLNSMEISY